MTVDELKTDIDLLCSMLKTVVGVFPSTNLTNYVNVLQSILDNPTILVLLNAWISTLSAQSTTAERS